MQGEHGQLDAKAHQETEVTEQAEGSTRRAAGQLGEVEAEAVAGEGQGQAAEQDQQGGRSRVEDEFGGGVLALLASPDCDQQVDRHQFQFPGQEEEQEVLGEENEPLGRGLHQHQGEVEAGFALDVPAGGHRKQGHQPGKQHQRCREPIGRQGPLQAEGRHPADPFHQLKIAD